MIVSPEFRAWTSRGVLLVLALVSGCTEDGSKSANGGTGGTVPGAGGTSGTGVLDPPPAPATSGVPQPSGTGTSPNLTVLPWAGFKAAITYTFDDTQPSQLEHWPELQATGARLTFFANPSGSWQSGYDAAWTAVADAGSEIGNHTWSHCRSDLSGCTAPVGTQLDEIVQTSTYITTHLGVEAVYSFAAPFGDAGWNVYAAPLFLAGRGVMSGMVPATGVSDWYNLPCFAVAAGQTATEFNAGIDNSRSQSRWTIFLFHSILSTTNNWYAGVQIADVTASLAYAQSLGDVWLDTFTVVAAYARAEQMFEKLSPSANTWTWTLPDHMPPGKILRVTVAGGKLSQGGTQLAWDAHGYYQVALDVGSLSWSP
jgi:peptidoglycan/xylan/chitin deacetylase (PgdA/CDA1 family)